MIDLLLQSPLLLLFTVIAIGYGLGEVRIGSFKLGVAAVLFVGLFFGALDPGLSVPQFIIFLGLSIFVYTVGLSSAPAFFASFRRHGFTDVYFATGTVMLSALLAFGIGWWFDFSAAVTGGLYAGASTNTPALAGLLDAIQRTAEQAGANELQSQQAVVGYSLAYPMGVLGVMLGLYLLQRWLRIDYPAEARALARDYPMGASLTSRTFHVHNEAIVGKTLRHFLREHPHAVAFGRMQHEGQMALSSWDTVPQYDDLLVLVGTEEAIAAAARDIGPPAAGQLNHDRSVFNVKRIFVSNEETAGKSIASLNLSKQFNVLITRVQRGDMDLLASGDTVLELGDRILLVAHREDLPAIERIFGNSYEALARVNLLSFGFGITLGLLLGMTNITLGSYTFSLGFAGGPLIVALILGQLRRTGPVVWTLPYGANLTLRQVGLILLLAGIGIRSGQTFYQTILTDQGWKLFVAGGIIAMVTTLTTLLVGYKVLRIPFSFLGGMVGSQPAVLDFAIEQAGSKYPNIGYTRMLPVVLIGKILAVQVLYNLLS